VLEKSILRISDLLGAEGEFISSVARAWLKQNAPQNQWKSGLSRGTRGREMREQFAELPLALQRRILHQQLLELGVVPDFETIECLRNHPELPITIPNRNQEAEGSDAPPCARKRRRNRARLELAAVCVVRNEFGRVRLEKGSDLGFRKGKTPLQLIGI